MTQEETIQQLADHFEAIIRLIGEDPDRQGLQKTPVRAAKAFYFATQGYRQQPSEILSQAIFDHEGSQLVVVRNIEFYSFCEHHILPFFGHISLGYIPDGKIIGLSKLARLVNVFARRLQVQERLTAQVVSELAEAIGAKGVMAICKADHLCMKMRGVEKQDANTVTTHWCGAFDNNPELRREFLDAVRD